MIKLMMRTSVVVMLLFACVFLPVSCQRQEDVSKQEINAAGYPERIVSISPGITEILFALGLEDRVVGVTNYCKYPAAAQGKAKIGGLFNLNFEAIVDLDPDCPIPVARRPVRVGVPP